MSNNGDSGIQYSCSVSHYLAHVKLHKRWSEAVGKPGYDKTSWMQKERMLHIFCDGGCLRNPPPVEDDVN